MSGTRPRNAGTKGRGRGRPPDLDSGELERKLLKAAERRFGEHGYAATSIRSIAEEAGANPALVHYYFGTKRDLLLAVLDRAFEPLAGGVAALSSDPDAGLEQVTALLFSTLREHPALARLVVREVLLAGGEFRELFIERYAPRLGGALPPVMARLRHEGRLRQDADPGIVALLVLSLCIFPVIARPIAEPVLGTDHSPDGLDRLRRQVDALLRRGVAA
ncbi:MAG: TetR/AcrR family transcriptional regulator [Gammaproteobacteria bacterium]